MDPNVGQADAAAMKKVDAEGNHRKFTKFFFHWVFTNNHDNSGGKLMVKWDIHIYIYMYNIYMYIYIYISGDSELDIHL